MVVGPKHIGIILDGNRRYARKNKINPLRGHEFGAKTVLDLFDWAKELGIKELTLYTFSTENFKRSKLEVDTLMRIFLKEADELISSGRLEKNRINIRFIGRLHLFNKKVRDKMEELMNLTKDFDSFKVNFCMAYGGRAEIIDAVNDLLKRGISKVDETIFQKSLYLNSEPDLIVRTSEQRLSNFLLWQSAYSEILFLPDKLWPEFSKEDLIFCVNEFKRRKRRFGK